MPVDWTYDQHGVVALDGRAGPPLFAEFAVADPPPERVPGFEGQVLPFDELPIPPPDGIDLRAAVGIDNSGHVRLYLNDSARCE